MGLAVVSNKRYVFNSITSHDDIGEIISRRSVIGTADNWRLFKQSSTVIKASKMLEIDSHPPPNVCEV